MQLGQCKWSERSPPQWTQLGMYIAAGRGALVLLCTLLAYDFKCIWKEKKEGCISSSYARKPPPCPRRRKVDVCYSELQVPRPFSSAFPCCFFFLAAHSSVENRSDNYSSIELTPLPWDRHKQWVIAAGQLHLLRSSNSSHPALMQLESRNYVPTLFWQ